MLWLQKKEKKMSVPFYAAQYKVQFPNHKKSVFHFIIQWVDFTRHHSCEEFRQITVNSENGDHQDDQGEGGIGPFLA